MRKAWMLFAVSTILAACGTNFIAEGPGGTNPILSPTTPPSSPTPTATPPPFALFQSNIQTILQRKTMVAGGCGQPACHDASANGGITLVTDTTAGPVSTVNMQANSDTLACGAHLDSFQPPSGVLVSQFCNVSPPTAVAGGTHQGTRTNFVNADCVSWIAWLGSGGPGTAMPVCQ